MNIFSIFEEFSTHETAVSYLESVRWKDGVVCPYCKSDKTCKHSEKNKSRWQCWNCRKSFSVTVGTIFHRSHMPLNKWFLLIALMLNARKGLSSCQAARDLNIPQKTVWSMMHRIRKAMATDQMDLLKGLVEMDECYIGGKPRKEVKKDDDSDENQPPKNKRGRGTKKTPVVGIVERDGNVMTHEFSGIKLTAKNLMDLVRKSVDTENSTLMTDEYKGYNKMNTIIDHKAVFHAYEYVNGNIHTNTIESFWAILKRGIVGQFHKVSKKYLQNYINEFEYRYNNRKQENDVTFKNLIERMC